MQPTAVISSKAEGLIYINGRLAGETAPDTPLILPVTPNGVIYMEFIPFSLRFRPAAYRLKMTSGEPDITASDEKLRLLIWPGGVIELSLTPLTAVPAESEYGIIDGVPAAMLRGAASLLRIGQSSVALPDSAQLPDKHITVNGCELYRGTFPGGEYAALFSSNDLSPKGAMTGDSISVDGGNIISVTSLSDSTGHLRRDIYSLSPDGLTLQDSDIIFPESGPAQPTGAESTALAAAEALLLGLSDEAAGFMDCRTPVLPGDVQYAMPMKYGVPDSQPAIALISRLSENAAKASPLYYKSALQPDGRYKITGFHI